MSFVPARSNKQEREASAARHVQAQILPALKELFRPELLNRIDEVVIFHTLEPEHLRDIVDLMLEKTRQRIAEQFITLHISHAARALLVERGYDPVYGARPLRRAVQRMLDDLLAESLLRGHFQPGDTVEVDVEEGQLVACVAVRVGVNDGQVAA